ncbi:hypothetical protein ASJ81_08160 [Methanosarcina spelaei]|uniref:Uncharacterized protein n=1 Tax=Methanosarcina spelaei TaxID=1036679 RepID=A0A2A2HRT6_9EURY|nr:hypothetical protein ASJ81_08160 [Methanosarcina spelaei]
MIKNSKNHVKNHVIPYQMSLEGTNSRANLQNSWPATVDPQPLRRLITPIGFGDKFFKSKRYLVFDQSFSEKVYAQAFFEKACDHAVTRDF